MGEVVGDSVGLSVGSEVGGSVGDSVGDEVGDFVGGVLAKKSSAGMELVEARHWAPPLPPRPWDLWIRKPHLASR